MIYSSIVEISLKVFVRDLIGYAVFAGIFALIALAGMKFRPRRRLQPGKWSSAGVRREITLSILSFAVFAATLPLLMYIFGVMNWSRRPDLLDGSFVETSLVILALILLHDAWFYWTHRLLHLPWFYKHVHSVHHKSKAPTAFASFAFHPFEAFLMGIFTPFASLFLPLSFPVVLAFNVHMIIRNSMAHAGVELFPRWMLSSRWVDWISPTSHHDTHHRYSGGNYGFYFRFWDRLMKTENDRFLMVFNKATHLKSNTEAVK